jgi:NACHT domain/Pentapeptide repeats (8 copies)
LVDLMGIAEIVAAIIATKAVEEVGSQTGKGLTAAAGRLVARVRRLGDEDPEVGQAVAGVEANPADKAGLALLAQLLADRADKDADLADELRAAASAAALERYLAVDLGVECEAAFPVWSRLDTSPQQHYVPLPATLGVGRRISEAPDTVRALRTRIEAQEDQGVVVTANYGEGKSFLVWRLALDLARRDQVVPLLCRLGELPSSADSASPFDQVTEAIRRHWPSLDVASLLGSPRPCLLILDGLDEMAVARRSPEEAVHWLLDGLRDCHRTTILLTARSGLFPGGAEEIGRLVPGYTLVTLRPWETRSWEQLLRSYEATRAKHFRGGWASFRDDVASKPWARELTSRPLWCRMLVDSSDEVLKAKLRGAASLYDWYVRWLLERTAERAPFVLFHQPTLILPVLERLAAQLTIRKATRLRASDLRDAARPLVQASDDELDQLIQRDLRTYTLLNVSSFTHPGSLRESRQDPPVVSFGHDSFRDFFRARAIVGSFGPIDGGSIRDAGGLGQLLEGIETDTDTARFVVGLMCEVPEWAGAATQLQGLLQRDPRRAFGDTGSHIDALRRSLLVVWLRYSREVVDQSPVLMPGFQLGGLYLSGMDLSHCRFEQADLAGATLHDCDLTGTWFLDTNCDFADFRRARCGGTVFEGGSTELALGLPCR